MAKARALADGRSYLEPDDIKAVAVAVLAHRLILAPEARSTGLTGEQIIRAALLQHHLPANHCRPCRIVIEPQHFSARSPIPPHSLWLIGQAVAGDPAGFDRLLHPGEFRAQPLGLAFDPPPLVAHRRAQRIVHRRYGEPPQPFDRSVT